VGLYVETGATNCVQDTFVLIFDLFPSIPLILISSKNSEGWVLKIMLLINLIQNTWFELRENIAAVRVWGKPPHHPWDFLSVASV
jgi:hypothetical protein